MNTTTILQYVSNTAIQSVADRLLRLQLPPLPVAPMQDSRSYPLRDSQGRIVLDEQGNPKPMFTGKNPSYLDRSGKPHLVKHSDFAKRAPTKNELRQWFANPLNGIGSLGGINQLYWLDLDSKHFDTSEALRSWVNSWIEQYPQLSDGWREITQSAGFRTLFKLATAPDFTNFALSPGGEHVGEIIGAGRFVVLAPTVGVSGNPYTNLQYGDPIELSDLSEVGIYSTKKPKAEPVTLRPIANLPVRGDVVALEDLIGGKAGEILRGGNPEQGHRSDDLTTLANEAFGWENYCYQTGVRLNGSAQDLLHSVGNDWGLDEGRIDRIIKTIDTAACRPACIIKGDEQTAEAKIKRLLGLGKSNGSKAHPVLVQRQHNQDGESDRPELVVIPGKQPKESAVARIVSFELKDKLIYSDQQKYWLQYSRQKPGTWNQISDEQALGLIQDELEKIPELWQGYSFGYAKGVLALCRKSLQVDSWETPRNLIPFKNGVYDLTGKRFIAEHSPAGRFTHQLPRNYNPIAQSSPNIDAWLNQIFDNDRDKRRFEALAAAVLRNMYREQIFAHFQGAPRAGKSTAMSLLGALAGSENCITTNLQAMNCDRFDTGRYAGKTVIMMPDHPDYSGDISVFLQVTGNDPIRVERKGKDAGSLVCSAIVLISSNGTVFKSRTGAELTERQILFSFTKPVERDKRDPNFKEKLFQDLEAWTNRLLALEESEIHSLLHDLDSDAAFRPDQWAAKLENDSIAAWADDCITIHCPESDFSMLRCKIGSASDADTLYGSYVSWCKESGKQPVARDNFSKLLLALLNQLFPDKFFAKERKTEGFCVTGIALRSAMSGNRPFISDLLFGVGNEPPMNPYDPPMNPSNEPLKPLPHIDNEPYEPSNKVLKKNQANESTQVAVRPMNSSKNTKDMKTGSYHSQPLQGKASSYSSGGGIGGSYEFMAGDRVWSQLKKATGVVLLVRDDEARVDFGNAVCWQPLAQLVTVNPEV